MPIYEFYCPDCHTLFSFLAPSTSTRRKPDCPRCGHAKLSRRPSRFAFVRVGAAEVEEDDLLGGLDEARLESAMSALAGEMDQMGDNEDPRAMGQIFRKFSDLTGLQLGDRMQEALSRMEQGEDLEDIEGELGDDDDLDDLFQMKKTLIARSRRPAVDEQLYFFDTTD
jgi:putative FmdB family regulatory protein